MDDKRRYSEKEIAEIFKNAAKAQEEAGENRRAGQGLSLTELQAIGAESGIPAEYIAKAALALSHSSEPAPVKMFLGSPVSVARTLDLPRNLTEDEWNALVVDLRSTFKAKGKIEQDGSFRQWTNGNLQFLLEPIGEGCRIRMKTLSSNAKGGLVSGIFYIVLGLIFMLTVFLSESSMTPLLFFAGFLEIMGIGLWAHYIRKLPKWAETRNQQMIEVGERLRQRMDVEGKEGETHVKTQAISLEDVPAKESKEKAVSRTRLRS